MKARLLLVFALLAIVSVCHATPSTLIWIPSTDIQPDRTWHLGIDNYFTPTDGFRSATDIGPEYGFAKGRAEAGIDYLGGTDSPFYLNAKYLLLCETENHPALAIGAFNFGFERDVTDFNMLYALGSKTCGPVRLTAGYCHGNKDALGVDPNMLLAGIDGYLTKDKKWWGAVDYQSGNNAFGAFNFGVSYAFAPNVSVIVGYDMYNATGADDTVTTQLDINF